MGRGILHTAEKIDTPESYTEMYRKYAKMSFETVYDLLADAKGALETKCVLGMDSARIEKHEIWALITLAEEVGNLAKLSKIAYEINQRYRDLTSSQNS